MDDLDQDRTIRTVTLDNRTKELGQYTTLDFLGNMDGSSDQKPDLFQDSRICSQGFDIFQWDWISIGDFFCTNAVGCVIGGWVIFRSGCFQAMDLANKSLNLTRSACRLAQRCSTRTKLDSKFVSLQVGGDSGPENG